MGFGDLSPTGSRGRAPAFFLHELVQRPRSVSYHLVDCIVRRASARHQAGGGGRPDERMAWRAGTAKAGAQDRDYDGDVAVTVGRLRGCDYQRLAEFSAWLACCA